MHLLTSVGKNMTQLNPNFIGGCVFAGSLGYALNGSHGAAIGLAIVSGIMTLIGLIFVR